MSIKSPGARLGHEITLEMARKRMMGQHKKSMTASLNLVAYIDMMTVMVIFLLMTFQASGEILFISKSIVLPNAMNWKELERAPVIGVSGDVVRWPTRSSSRRPTRSTGRSPTCTISS